jgi:hypothetical protein
MKLKQTISVLTVIFASASPALANPNYERATDALYNRKIKNACSEVSLGYDIQSGSISSQSSGSSSDRKEGGGDVSAFGVRVRGNGGRSTSRTYQQGSSRSQHSQTVVRGVTCDAAVNAGAQLLMQVDNNYTDREINKENNRTRRLEIRSNRLGRRFQY